MYLRLVLEFYCCRSASSAGRIRLFNNWRYRFLVFFTRHFVVLYANDTYLMYFQYVLLPQPPVISRHYVSRENILKPLLWVPPRTTYRKWNYLTSCIFVFPNKQTFHALYAGSLVTSDSKVSLIFPIALPRSNNALP